MTPAEMRLWASVQRRAASLSPELQREILRSFQRIRDGMTEAQIVRAVQLGGVDRLFDEVLTQALMDVAMQPVRERMRESVGQSFRYTATQLPKPPRNVTVTVAFDLLNPKVIDAVRALETVVITGLTDTIRETVRAYTENALRDGVGPAALARQIKPLIGLGPAQLSQVQHYRAALEGREGRKETDYTLRDKRFAAGKQRTAEQIDAMVARYTDRRIAQNAETVARTAALDALKLGQHLVWVDAVAKGIVDGNRLTKQWIGTDDGQERPEHVQMNNQVVPWDSAYSNGQMIPGDDEYNCRCISRYSQRAA